MKASYCLESVGHDQRKLNTTLYYSRAPDSTPSFVNDHFEAVLERLPKQWGWVGRNEADISPIVVSPVPYTPWSDNSTWAAHGIPSALLMSWPDEYFHSQLLTAEVTDPAVFGYAGAMVAASAYEVANAGLEVAGWACRVDLFSIHFLRCRLIPITNRSIARAIPVLMTSVHGESTCPAHSL